MACGIITCDEKGISPEQIFRRAIRMAADGCPALSVAAVEGLEDCAPFFECIDGVTPNITWKQLFGLLTGLNGNGCFSLNVVVSGANCRLQDLDYGEIHCNNQSLVIFNPFGDMSYQSYYYQYEYSTNGGSTWVAFGINTSSQQVDNLPGYGTPGLYLFRAKIRCNVDDTYFRTVYFATSGTPFVRFLQVSVNGGAPIHLKSTTEGVNYFCSTDVLRFIQPNTNYTTGVIGPGGFNWTSDDQTWNPVDNMPDGIYDATFTDLTGAACNGSKAFEIVRMPKPVITGDLALCAGESTVLDAGAGYDTYLWNTGATTQTINVTTAGSFFVSVGRNNTPGCTIASDPVDVTLAPALDPIVTSKANWDAACVVRNSNTLYTQIVGQQWELHVQDYGVGASYDFGFGAGPDPFLFVNGPANIDITVTLNGCSTTLHVDIAGIENNTSYVVTEQSSSPCCKRIDLSVDPEVIQANVIISVFGNVSGLIGTFTNQLIIDFCIIDPLDTSWGAVLEGTGTTGCPKVLLLSEQPVC